jgi:prophage regulatory protein
MEVSDPARSPDEILVADAGAYRPIRLLRLPEVIARVGLRRSAIYQRMSEGRFPKSRSLGPRCTVWVEAKIDAWIALAVAGSQGTGVT